MKSGDTRSRTTTDRAPYLITLRGDVDPRWVTWLDGIAVKDETGDEAGPMTILQFAELDQPKLRGVLTRLWDLNLIVVSVQRLPPPAEPAADRTAGSA